jgi:orotate phosphoribosyltransferase
LKKKIAEILLNAKAVILNSKKLIKFKSGIMSPIYTDNRKLLGFVPERGAVVDALVKAAERMDFEVVVGTATAGIPWATLVAERLGLPLAYCRAQKKEHGLGKNLEGAEVKGRKALIIEDLVSTGFSSGTVIEICKEAGAIKTSLLAIFTYEFREAADTFAKMECNADFLTDFSSMIEQALGMGLITGEERDLLNGWSQDPFGWAEKNGLA